MGRLKEFKQISFSLIKLFDLFCHLGLISWLIFSSLVCYRQGCISVLSIILLFIFPYLIFSFLISISFHIIKHKNINIKESQLLKILFLFILFLICSDSNYIIDIFLIIIISIIRSFEIIYDLFYNNKKQ